MFVWCSSNTGAACEVVPAYPNSDLSRPTQSSGQKQFFLYKKTKTSPWLGEKKRSLAIDIKVLKFEAAGSWIIARLQDAKRGNVTVVALPPVRGRVARGGHRQCKKCSSGDKVLACFMNPMGIQDGDRICPSPHTRSCIVKRVFDRVYCPLPAACTLGRDFCCSG